MRLFASRRRPRVTFRDRGLERSFRRDGFVVVPFLERRQVEALSDLFASGDSGIESGFYSSLHSGDGRYRRAADEGIRRIVGDAPSRWLSEHRPFVAGFAVKHPGPDSELPVHQDWSMVDERRHTSLNCWIPVTEMSEDDGPLWVLPGSHLAVPGLRGSPSFPSALDGRRDIIRDECMQRLAVRRGEAVIHDNRLVHYSPENRGPKQRVAVYFNAMPPEATPIHWYRAPDGSCTCHVVDRDFYSTFQIGQRPRGEVVAELSEHQPDRRSIEDLDRLISECRSRRRDRDRQPRSTS